MYIERYLLKLESIKKELEMIKYELSKLERTVVWTENIIISLIAYLVDFKKVMETYPMSISETQARDEIEYFEKNLKGLKLILKSKRDGIMVEEEMSNSKKS